ncbi:MAG TPA: flagella basal body P-ring formation protein FlgA, partial [Nitrosomonas sp.]|nr:flagella basal body P-ring formation protein FlgA [Nitrosomonas sp.]
TEVEALSAAAEGQVLQIRNQKGRIMTGVARQDGIVEIKRK